MEKIKAIVAGASDLDNLLDDGSLNLTSASSLDLMFMTSELEDQPYSVRPYVWDLIAFLQKKLLKLRKHASLNGLDSVTLAKRVS